MTRRWIGCLLCGVLGCLAAAALGIPAALSADYDLMLDRSGSMAGFAKSGTAWPAIIEGLQSGADQRYSFGSGVTPHGAGKSLLGVPLKDGLTKIGPAMKIWLDASVEGDGMIMVTDNVVDYGDREKAKAQEDFYHHVTASESLVNYAGLVVLRLPFAGKIYPLHGGGSDDYSGQRALVIYVFSRGDRGDFDVLMTRVEQVLGQVGIDHRTIRIKPFDISSFRTRSPDSGFQLKVPQHLAGKLAIQGDKLWMRNLQVGDELSFPLEVEIASDSPFVLRNVRAESSIRFDDPQRLVREAGRDFRVSSDPPTADIQPNTVQVFTIKVEGPRFSMAEDKGLLHRAWMTLSGEEPVTGALDVSFFARLKNADLGQGLLDEWSYEGDPDALGNPNAPNVHDRVYSMKRLVMDLMPSNEDREEVLLNQHLDLRMDLRYPLAPLLGVLLMAALAILVLVLLLRWLAKRREFLLIDDYGRELRFVPAFLATKRIYPPRNGQGPYVFSLTYLFVGFAARGGPKYRIDGSWFVSGQGDSIRAVAVGEDDYDVMAWDLRPVNREGAAEAAARDPWGDQWGT